MEKDIITGTDETAEAASSLIVDMTEGNITKKLIKFSLPLMAANLMNTLYTLVDLAIVGQFIGSVGLSAVSISGQFTMLFMAVGMGFGNGGQIIVSQIVGRKDYGKLPTATGTLFTLKLSLSLLILVVGILARGFLLRIINTPAEALPDADTYLLVCCIGVPFVYAYNAFAAVLRGMGDSRRPFYFITVGTVTNVVLDLWFVAGLDMGVFGAALATVISQILCCVFAITYVYRKREEIGFDFKLKSFVPDRPLLGMLVRISSPLALMTICINLSMTFVMSFVNAYGVVAAAVTGTGSKLYSVMSVVTQAMQSSSATMVGQNMGAKKYDRVKSTVLSTLVICVVFFAVIGTLCLIFPKQIFGIFNREPEVLELSVSYMKVAFWMFLSFALMAPFLGLITGIGYTTLNLGIALLDGVVARIGLSLLLGITLGMGLEGFWWGNALASYVSVILGGVYFFSGRWRKRALFE